MRLQQLDTELKRKGLNMTFREKQSLLSQSGPISEVLERHLNPPQAPQLPALQMGGPIPKKPIPISDPKEFAKRNQLYNDSLLLHNLSYAQYNAMPGKGDVREVFSKRIHQPSPEIVERRVPKGGRVEQHVYKEPDFKINTGELGIADYWHPEIAPTKEYRGYSQDPDKILNMMSVVLHGMVGKDPRESSINLLYDKPVQPVFYDPQVTPKITQPQKPAVEKRTEQTIEQPQTEIRPRIIVKRLDTTGNVVDQDTVSPSSVNRRFDADTKSWKQYQTGGQYDPTPASNTRVAMPPMLPLEQMLQDDERVRRIEENQRLASQLPNELKYQGPVPAQGKIDYPSTDRRSGNFSGTPNMQFAAPNMKGQMRANTEEFYAGLLDPGIPGMGMGNRIASSVAKMRRPLNRYLPTRYGVQRADDMRSMRNAPDIDPDKKREMLMRDMEESLMNDREEALQQMSYADEFDYDEMIMAENIEASINRSNPELDRLNEIIRNQLRNQIPAIQYPTFGKPAVKNKSGYTKDELLQIAKNKDVLQSMDDDAIRNTVLKPNGEVVPYNTESLEPYFSGKNNVNMIPVEEYTSRINDNIQRLNTIIANKNTSGVDYRAVRLDPRGVLEFEVPSMPGKTTWSVGINPGEWRGEVEDVVDAMYLKSVPGLQMRGTAGSVFPDGVPRKGTRAYESLNEYLKELGLGRVSSGFNSQTRSSEGVWDNLINSDRAVGYKANKGLTYGTMKTGLGAAAGLETYRRAQNQE